MSARMFRRRYRGDSIHCVLTVGCTIGCSCPVYQSWSSGEWWYNHQRRRRDGGAIHWERWIGKQVWKFLASDCFPWHFCLRSLSSPVATHSPPLQNTPEPELEQESLEQSQETRLSQRRRNLVLSPATSPEPQVKNSSNRWVPSTDVRNYLVSHLRVSEQHPLSLNFLKSQRQLVQFLGHLNQRNLVSRSFQQQRREKDYKNLLKCNLRNDRGYEHFCLWDPRLHMMWDLKRSSQTTEGSCPFFTFNKLRYIQRYRHYISVPVLHHLTWQWWQIRRSQTYVQNNLIDIAASTSKSLRYVVNTSIWSWERAL